MEKVLEASPTVVAKVVSPEIDIEKVQEAASEIDIEKVQEAASDYFQNLTVEQKEAAESFFKTMDEDGDGSISAKEFTNFLSDAGYQNVNPDKVFEDLDKDNNGTLNFEELVTFFYILRRDSEVPDPEANISPGMAGGAKAQAKISPRIEGGAKAQAKISPGITGEPKAQAKISPGIAGEAKAQAKISPGIVGEAKAQGWKANMTFLKGLCNKFMQAFGLREWVNEKVSTIV